MPRYVLEGEWTGYTCSQQRVVHREVVSKKFAEQAKTLRSIVYTDGTSLLIHVREAKPRESVETIPGYSNLIRDALRHGGPLVLVSDLAKPKTAAEAINDVRRDLTEIMSA